MTDREDGPKQEPGPNALKNKELSEYEKAEEQVLSDIGDLVGALSEGRPVNEQGKIEIGPVTESVDLDSSTASELTVSTYPTGSKSRPEGFVADIVDSQWLEVDGKRAPARLEIREKDGSLRLAVWRPGIEVEEFDRPIVASIEGLLTRIRNTFSK